MNVLATGRRTVLCLTVIGASVAAMTVPAQAHHAWASVFDIDRVVKVEGSLKKLEMTNPHGWIYVDVKGPDGQIEEWKFETGNGQSLARQGFTKTSVKIGTAVVVEGFLAKGVARTGSLQLMMYPDGRRVLVGNSQQDGGPPPTQR